MLPAYSLYHAILEHNPRNIPLYIARIPEFPKLATLDQISNLPKD